MVSSLCFSSASSALYCFLFADRFCQISLQPLYCGCRVVILCFRRQRQHRFGTVWQGLAQGTSPLGFFTNGTSFLAILNAPPDPSQVYLEGCVNRERTNSDGRAGMRIAGAGPVTGTRRIEAFHWQPSARLSILMRLRPSDRCSVGCIFTFILPFNPPSSKLLRN